MPRIKPNIEIQPSKYGDIFIPPIPPPTPDDVKTARIKELAFRGPTGRIAKGWATVSEATLKKRIIIEQRKKLAEDAENNWSFKDVSTIPNWQTKLGEAGIRGL